MEYTIELAKGKGLGLKDIDINKLYIWVNGPKQLGQLLMNSNNPELFLDVGGTRLPCFFGDSSQHIRVNKDNFVLIHLMISVDPLVVGAILVNPLKLIIN